MQPSKAVFLVIMLGFALPGSFAQFPSGKGIPTQLQPLLGSLQAEIMFPLDGGYQEAAELWDNAFFPCHYRLVSRTEGIEIRFFLQPEGKEPIPPKLESRRLALHLCSNDENAVITAREMEDFELENLFGADWGMVHLFPPKTAFGQGALFCQMASIYKAGRGSMHIFFFFNEPSPLVENRLYLARFQ